MRQSTIGVWAGEEGPKDNGSSHLSIVARISFDYPSADEWADVALGLRPGHIYSRNSNPTVNVFEEKVRWLEEAEAATSFASGMAAISNTLGALLRPGDRVVSITDTYGGTHRIFTEFLPQMGISVELYDPIDEDSLERAIARGCRLVYLESPTNPTLKVVDLQKLADAAHTVGALVVTDNTVATPINQNPLKLGSDLVVHSASKFLGGHGDALGGAIAGSTELVTRVFRYREINGAALDPFAAFLLARGIRTLELRVARQNENALAVARFLESHRAVDRVFYPGLESHPNHDTAAKQMRGFGGMLSFTIRDTAGRGVTAFLDRLRLARKAASLGHVETMAGTPATTSHVECTAAQRAAMGIPDTLVRYSVGIENVADLIEDLQRALN
ncbi:MAG TPA: aminotransferase class I/II-fold pyridoxal phosphate-dependent enzyme [Candidatus Acidoferrales bacterium]|nr:aminotransferase class I/II-fold pyridoxal phosphate-dependent enzyme [Candidatus Acidoferrales bacterium]